MSGTWRKVAVVNGPYTGRGSTLGPDTHRRTRWWELTLECGHEAERTVRYRRFGDPQRNDDPWRISRTAADILPPPKRALCDKGNCKTQLQAQFGNQATRYRLD